MKYIPWVLLLIIVILCGWYLFSFNSDKYQKWGIMPLPLEKPPLPLWERKVPLEGAAPLKIGVITDTHIKSRGQFSGDMENRYLTEKAQKIFKDFRAGMEEFDPEIIVHLGDLIEGSGDGKEEGVINIGLVRAEMESLGKPIHWVIGNHDLRSIARKQWLESLEIDYVNGYIDNGPYRFVIVDASWHKIGAPQNPTAGDYVPGHVSKETRAWLENVLNTDQHVIVLSHQSFIKRHDVRKSPVFHSAELRDMFSKYNVMAVFQGHIERRYYGEHDGVKYYAFPGAKKSPLYPNAFYDMTLSGDQIDVVMHYRNPNTEKKVTEPFNKDGAMVLNEMEMRELTIQEDEHGHE